MAVNTVKAVINGQTYNLSFNSTSGKWEATITAPNATSWNEESHKYGINIRAEDYAGNVATKDRKDSTLGTKLQLRVLEKDKPIVTLLAPSSGARVTTAKPTMEFNLRDSGSGIDISSLEVKIDGGSAIKHNSAGMSCTSVTGGYNCSYIPTIALNEGAHTITISVRDNDGNISTLLSSTFTIDTAPPALNVASPAAGLITKNTTVTVSGTTNDVTSNPMRVNIKLNGTDQGNISLSGVNFSKSITLREGLNTIEVIATDAAGLTSKVTRTVTLDSKAPVITNVTISANPVDAGKTFIIEVEVDD